MVMSDPGFLSLMKKGPAPTGRLLNSSPRSATASFGTGQLVATVSPSRKVVVGSSSVSFSVWSSTTSMPSTSSASPSAKASGAFDREEVAGPTTVSDNRPAWGPALGQPVGDILGGDLARLEVGAREHGAGLQADGVHESVVRYLGHAIGEAGFQLAFRREVIQTSYSAPATRL